ncbi:MAG: DUF6265 family protein [Pseudomonadota bacterium]
MIRSTVSLILLSTCASAQSAAPDTSDQFDWLTGCWQSEDGSSRETWSASEDGYYFGYSVVYQDGQAIFFEQMRIDPGATPTFNAYPRGAGPSPFPATEQTGEAVTFANAAHDYPQKIRYWRDGDKLRATISLFDGSQANTFSFAACVSD